MDSKRELLHKILDGEASRLETETVERAVESDPEFQEDCKALLNTVKFLEQGTKLEAPAGFTADVLKKLPTCRPSRLDRIKEILFSTRQLRWNMATAVSLGIILLFTSIYFLQVYGRQHGPTVARQQNRQAVTVRVEFSAPYARQVALAGDFNRWSTDTTPMKRDTSGIWSVEIAIEPGVYAYMFIIDGTAWVPDPRADSFRDDGFGEKNSVLRVGI